MNGTTYARIVRVPEILKSFPAWPARTARKGGEVQAAADNLGFTDPCIEQHAIHIWHPFGDAEMLHDHQRELRLGRVQLGPHGLCISGRNVVVRDGVRARRRVWPAWRTLVSNS